MWLHKADPTYSRARPKKTNKQNNNVFASTFFSVYGFAGIHSPSVNQPVFNHQEKTQISTHNRPQDGSTKEKSLSFDQSICRKQWANAQVCGLEIKLLSEQLPENIRELKQMERRNTLSYEGVTWPLWKASHSIKEREAVSGSTKYLGLHPHWSVASLMAGCFPSHE